MDNKFGGVIWTNHALQRLSERGIAQGDAWAAWRNPDQSRYATAKGAWIYYKTYGDQRIEVVAKQNERKEWLILSVWSRPVYENSHQESNSTKKQSFLVKLLRKLFGMN